MPTPFIAHSTLLAGTRSNLTCDYSPHYYPHIIPSATWTVNETEVTQNNRVLIEGVTLSFSPLITSDSGMYSCELIITSLTPHVIIEGSPKTCTELQIVVESKFMLYWASTYSLLFQISL